MQRRGERFEDGDLQWAGFLIVVVTGVAAAFVIVKIVCRVKGIIQ